MAIPSTNSAKCVRTGGLCDGLHRLCASTHNTRTLLPMCVACVCVCTQLLVAIQYHINNACLNPHTHTHFIHALTHCGRIYYETTSVNCCTPSHRRVVDDDTTHARTTHGTTDDDDEHAGTNRMCVCERNLFLHFKEPSMRRRSNARTQRMGSFLCLLFADLRSLLCLLSSK